MHIEFENSSNGVSGTSLDLPNVVAIGDDHDDALRLFHEALREHVAYHERTIEIVAA
jgi:predicted RNase H-like HicB family nuclease